MGFEAKIKFWLLVGLCKAVGWLPAWFLYRCLAAVLYFTLYKVAGYRVKVVRGNLADSFPEKPPQELRRIEREFYRFLAEAFIDAIDMVGISRRQLDKRMEFENMEEHEAATAGRDWIAALAHYGSWEYFGAYQLHTASQVVGVYRPLHDKVFDRFYRYSRSRFGLEPVAMKNILRYMVDHVRKPGRNTALGLIGDQNAPPSEHSIWFEFLNHKTSFFAGIERIALKFGLPVYYMDVVRLRRIRYRARLVMIYDGREQVAEGEITARYVRKLEETIRRDPAYWMWSHKRWKFKYEGQRIWGQ